MQLYIYQVKDIFVTNTYFYIDEETLHGCIIDPGAQGELLLDIIEENNWKIDAILITHSHFDHIGAVNLLVNKLNIPYFIHKAGLEYIQSAELNLSDKVDRNIKISREPNFVQDGSEFSLENINMKLEIIYAPGHSYDSVIYYDSNNKVAFVGDILYDNGIGIWKFLGGDKIELYKTIERICEFSSETICFTGHTLPIEVASIKKIIE